jgi:regulator of Ty1 transposition protein 109
MNLRDELLQSLKSLPGPREFHLHVLVSSPRRHSSLFPFAHPRPKIFLQDVLVLLSEQTSLDGPRVFVTAIEASVYHVPATSCAILYVSKVDSTGQATPPSPTPALLRALLLHYADPATRPVRADHVWIQLFARAQGQYLFPDSAEYTGKRPLGDVRLCVWWMRALGDAGRELVRRERGRGRGEAVGVGMYYVLPGLSALEAAQSLKFAAAGASRDADEWVYGHPYSQTEIPLPCPASEDEDHPRHLGHCVPSFEDDPKNRFMDEIAYTTEGNGVRSPRKKRPRTVSGARDSEEAGGGSSDRRDDRPPPAYGEIAQVTPDEFWERMSFRQECVAGAITGFFAVGITCPIPKDADLSRFSTSPLEPRPGQVPSSLIKRIMTDLLTGHEFSTRERAIRATEALETAIKGLCEGLTPTPIAKPLPRLFFERSKTPEQEPRAPLVSPSTPPRRVANGRPAATVDVTPNPFPEPVASLETYQAHIYDSVCVSNLPVASRLEMEESKGAAVIEGKATGAVTVLAVRKKKKRTEG